MQISLRTEQWGKVPKSNGQWWETGKDGYCGFGGQNGAQTVKEVNDKVGVPSSV